MGNSVLASLHEVPPQPIELFEQGFEPLAGDLLVYLEQNRGNFTYDQCQTLYKEINRIFVPFREGRWTPGIKVTALIIMLEGNVSAAGPLDHISKFVEVFGSEAAKKEFQERRPAREFAKSTGEASTPSNFGVLLEEVTDRVRKHLPSWLTLR